MGRQIIAKTMILFGKGCPGQQPPGTRALSLCRLPHRSLLVSLPDVECVLEYGVHDAADAERRLDHVGDHLLHCGADTKTTGRVNTKRACVCVCVCASSVVICVLAAGARVDSLTVQSLLEPLDADHVLGELEGLALRLDDELTGGVGKNPAQH